MKAPDLSQLYERYGAAVYQRCCYLLHDEDQARDATQDIFLKAERAREGFEGRSSWSTWLLRIATHHCLNLIRARKVRLGRGRLGPEALERECPRDPRAERLMMVRSLLERFDLKTQRLVLHYFVDEMTQGEVAELLNLSVPTVRKRIRAFSERAKREWEPKQRSAK